MKITAIRQQIKNAERASIFVDNKYSLSLTLDELLEQRLKPGDDLDDSRLNKLKKISADGKLRMRALEWTLNRPRSLREFRDYMRRKQAEPELTEKLIAEFQERSYLDEPNFARWLVELRARSGKSDRAIRAELARKGINRELADETLQSEAGEEAERIQQVITKKSKLPRYQADPQKLMRYLASQGFSYDLIKQHLLD